MDYLLPGLSRTSPPSVRKRSDSDAEALSEGDDVTTDNVNVRALWTLPPNTPKQVLKAKIRRNESFNNLMENLEALASAAGLKDLPTVTIRYTPTIYRVTALPKSCITLEIVCRFRLPRQRH